MKSNRILYLPMLLFSCSGLEQAQQAEIKKANEHVEAISRMTSYEYAPEFQLIAQEREPYPWEKEWVGRLPKISKEYFRCRGTHGNPPLKITDGKGDLSAYQFDCNGFDEHSLPIDGKEETVSPLLIEMMNGLQEKLQKKAVITAGHRCPDHNAYVGGDPHSKHLVGARVAFYLEGLQDSAYLVAQALLTLYKEDPRFGPLKVLSPGTWGNKELEIVIHPATEKKDKDNAHPYAYLTIELKVDRSSGKPINTDWNKIHRGYWKWSNS